MVADGVRTWCTWSAGDLPASGRVSAHFGRTAKHGTSGVGSVTGPPAKVSTLLYRDVTGLGVVTGLKQHAHRGHRLNRHNFEPEHAPLNAAPIGRREMSSTLAH